MESRSAWLGTAAFTAVPLVVGGVLPWQIGQSTTSAGWPATPVLTVVGWVFVLVGTAGLLESFVRFARDGRGTPAPIGPTERLVVTGFYRFMRNAMYDFVLLVILGQALLFRSTAVIGYAASFVVFVVSFVLLCENRRCDGATASSTSATARSSRAGCRDPATCGHQTGPATAREGTGAAPPLRVGCAP